MKASPLPRSLLSPTVGSGALEVAPNEVTGGVERVELVGLSRVTLPDGSGSATVPSADLDFVSDLLHSVFLS